MPSGGVRKGAGRPKGAKTKKSAEIREAAAAKGLTPLEVMLITMQERWDAADKAGAVEVAHPGQVWLKKGLDDATRAKTTCAFVGLMLYKAPSDFPK